MKIYRSFGELATVFLLILVAVAFLMYVIIDKSKNLKYDSLRNNAISFSDTVNKNQDSFKNYRIVYLDEVVNEQLMSNIKSPFSSKKCDVTQSYVELESNNKRYVTLTCDNYVLYRYNSTEGNYNIFKIGEWRSERKSNQDEEKVLYNCIDPTTGEVIYGDYYEANYLLYKINADYDKSYNDVSKINDSICKIDSKIFYRDQEEVYIKKD